MDDAVVLVFVAEEQDLENRKLLGCEKHVAVACADGAVAGHEHRQRRGRPQLGARGHALARRRKRVARLDLAQSAAVVDAPLVLVGARSVVVAEAVEPAAALGRAQIAAGFARVATAQVFGDTGEGRADVLGHGEHMNRVGDGDGRH